MEKIKIDLPLEHDYPELEVICMANENFHPKVAGQRLYELLGKMPLSAVHELFGRPDFQKIYQSYLEYKSSKD